MGRRNRLALIEPGGYGRAKAGNKLSAGNLAESRIPLADNRKRSSLIALCALITAAQPAAADAADLEVTITNLRNDQGFVDVTLYDHAKGWLDDTFAVGNLTLKAHEGSVHATFGHLKPGRYAIVTTHDENGNGRMDFVLGLPAEGYAFSNDIRPFFSAPSFERAAFDVGTTKREIAIKMVYPLFGKLSKRTRDAH
jgi:uncharacterized protein (DUF2141 family)